VTFIFNYLINSILQKQSYVAAERKEFNKRPRIGFKK